MSHNTFGHLFRVTTWGESHGPGDRLRGRRLPAGSGLDRGRHPGLARQATAGAGQVRHPAPGAGRRAHPLRRVFEDDGRTASAARSPPARRSPCTSTTSISVPATTPTSPPAIGPVTPTTAYQAKYGVRDYRGGGRQSARETACRVAAGAVARKVLGDGDHRARRPGPDRTAQDRRRAVGLGRRRIATPSGVPTPKRSRSGNSIWSRHPQSRLVHRRGGSDRG